MDDRLKTFICSISAIQIGPGVTLEIDREVLLCRIDANTNPEGQFAAAVAQLPLLLVQHETEEAKDYALRRARELFPVAEGWSNHATSLIEIPRSTFLQMQLFITVRELVYQALVLTGFKVQR